MDEITYSRQDKDCALLSLEVFDIVFEKLLELMTTFCSPESDDSLEIARRRSTVNSDQLSSLESSAYQCVHSEHCSVWSKPSLERQNRDKRGKTRCGFTLQKECVLWRSKRTVAKLMFDKLSSNALQTHHLIPPNCNSDCLLECSDQSQHCIE